MTWITIGTCILFGIWLIRQTRRNLFKSEGVTGNLQKHPVEFTKPEITYVSTLKKESEPEVQPSKKNTK